VGLVWHSRRSTAGMPSLALPWEGKLR
jgi:hypothetical protein